MSIRSDFILVVRVAQTSSRFANIVFESKVERVKQMESDGGKQIRDSLYALNQLMEGSVLTQTIISARNITISPLNSSSFYFPVVRQDLVL